MSTITNTATKNGAPVRRSEPKPSSPPQDKRHLVACRAYEIFVARKGGPGDEVSDWLRAEKEVGAVAKG
ncbi:MAG TPA: DUF2934 domain-containing protein [Phycisphaerales bacterium]|nr:DUF2934 domain-containing protein [Phycisphaerales bacterium]